MYTTSSSNSHSVEISEIDHFNVGINVQGHSESIRICDESLTFVIYPTKPFYNFLSRFTHSNVLLIN